MIDQQNEIELLRRERLQWFIVARQLAWRALSDKTVTAYLTDEIDEYLRARGICEDPRDCF